MMEFGLVEFFVWEFVFNLENLMFKFDLFRGMCFYDWEFFRVFDVVVRFFVYNCIFYCLGICWIGGMVDFVVC